MITVSPSDEDALMKVLVIVSLSVLAAAVLAAQAPAAGSRDLTRVNPQFTVPVGDVQKWHAAKDAGGPTLSGNASWRAFVGTIESELKAMGAVDITRNAFTYDRWSTSEWPDTSKWSLIADGKPVRVASYGANSGTTPPEGVTAGLVFYDPAQPPASIDGKIVVFQLERETEKTPDDKRVYEYPGDYLFLSNPETFPDPRVPRKANMTVTSRSEMRQATGFIPLLTKGKAAGAVFLFDASHDRLAGLYTFGVPGSSDADAVRWPGRRASAHRGCEAGEAGDAPVDRHDPADRNVAADCVSARSRVRDTTRREDLLHDAYRRSVDLTG
jgi:hypothetical protein